MMRYSYFALAGATAMLMTFACGDDEDSSSSLAGPGATSSGSSTGGSSTSSSSAGGSSTTTNTTASTGSGGAPCNDYPAGPYGNEVGETMAPLAWEGYVNATGDAVSNTLTYGPYGTQHIFCDPNKGPYALVHLALVT